MLQVEAEPLPDALDAYLGYMRVRITEELAWLRGSPLYTVMDRGGGGSCAPGDKALLEVLRPFQRPARCTCLCIFFSCTRSLHARIKLAPHWVHCAHCMQWGCKKLLLGGLHAMIASRHKRRGSCAHQASLP
jgi:hypothetical protein